jgi:hypothetical protein
MIAFSHIQQILKAVTGKPGEHRDAEQDRPDQFAGFPTDRIRALR